VEGPDAPPFAAVCTEETGSQPEQFVRPPLSRPTGEAKPNRGAIQFKPGSHPIKTLESDPPENRFSEESINQ